MLFSERRNSVIIESDLDTQLYDIDERESDNVISERNNSEDREQGVVRLGKKAKFTLRRVFSRSNSGQAIEMKTYALTNEKKLANCDSLSKRRNSEQYDLQRNNRLTNRRRTIQFEPEYFHRPNAQNQKRRFSTYNVTQNTSDGTQNTTASAGLFIKHRRPSISKQFQSPINASLSQNASKIAHSNSSVTRKRRTKSSGFVDGNDNDGTIFEDNQTQKGKENKKFKASPITNRIFSNTNIATNSPLESKRKMESSSPTTGASNILKTLNAAKLSTNTGMNMGQALGSQNTPKVGTVRDQKSPNRPIRAPHRRRVAVSFSNYQTGSSPVVLSKFQPNKEFDSTF